MVGEAIEAEAPAARPARSLPWQGPDAPLLFVVNAASGNLDADAKRRLIEEALGDAAPRAQLRFGEPGAIGSLAIATAAEARRRGGAIVAVGGDGTISTVAQAAHDEGCVMGAVALGTFNYFARLHGLGTDVASAVRVLVDGVPAPVQVGDVNGRVFLVNASLGLYPALLEDRETYKARFGRNRLVAIAAVVGTLLRNHRQLRLEIESGAAWRRVRTPTLFVGNNRLQLEQVGVREAPALDEGCLAAVMLKPIGTGELMLLALRGAFGTLGDADTIDTFGFRRMTVRPRLPGARRQVKVAFDGEVGWMRWPLQFRVSPRPLWLLKPPPARPTEAR